MTSGRALTYVQPETASQVLCQVLQKGAWERLLDSKIGRKPLDLPHAGCHIVTDWGQLSVQLRESERAFEAETTIAGRPAKTYDGGFVVALTDDALRATTGGQHLTLRTLEVAATGDDGKVDSDIAMRVLTEIVPLLAKEAEPLPNIEDGGNVPYVTTPLTGGDQFVDLPLPVQAIQLCTVLLEGGDFRVAAKEVVVDDSGECRLSTDQGTLGVEMVYSDARLDFYMDTVAGRPATVTPETQRVSVRLRDDAEVELRVSGPDSVALAEKLVPLLVG